MPVWFKAFHQEYRAFQQEYRAFHQEYRAFHQEYRAFHQDYRDFLKEYRADRARTALQFKQQGEAIRTLAESVQHIATEIRDMNATFHEERIRTNARLDRLERK